MPGEVRKKKPATWIFGNHSREWILWMLLIAGGIVLRLQLYAAYLSLGNDDAALARNIANRAFSGLTRPLDYNQAAPVLFLFIQKTILMVFGNRDYILELFPLFSGLLALYLFYWIARRHFGAAGLFAFFAFAISFYLIHYSSTTKQYSSDVMIALLLVDLSDRCLDASARPRDFVLLGLTGGISIWVSHPAVLILAGIGLVIAFQKWARRDHVALAWTLGMGSLWAVMLGLEFMLLLRVLFADRYLQSFWHAGFMPLPPWNNLGWFVDTYLAVLFMTLSRTSALFAWVWLFLSLLGAASLLARQRSLALVFILPFVMALLASLLQKYPLRAQFVLFLVPFVYLLVAEGFRRLYLWAAGWNRRLALSACAVLSIIVLWPAEVSAKRNFLAPIHYWDMRPVVVYIRDNWREGDTVLVSGGGETFSYYAESLGLVPSHPIIDTNHRIIRWGIFKRDVAALKGQQRVWVVFAHWEQSAEYTRYAKYLARYGTIVHTFSMGYHLVYLCNLNP